jgi:hypothetical protein
LLLGQAGEDFVLLGQGDESLVLLGADGDGRMWQLCGLHTRLRRVLRQ